MTLHRLFCAEILAKSRLKNPHNCRNVLTFSLESDSMVFSELTTAHLPLLKKYLPRFGTGDCDLTLASLLSRGIHSKVRFCEYNGTHLVFERSVAQSDTPVFVMPIGEADIPQALFDQLANTAQKNTTPLKFFGRVDQIESILNKAFSGSKLLVENNPDRWDYIYACTDFVELAGSHFHSKRNFVKRFYKACPEAHFSIYTTTRYEDCMRFLNDWYKDREMDEGLEQERAAIQTVLSHWEELPVYGGILEENGKILGLTYGARSACDILAVHIEKAVRTVPGAYPALSQAFAKSLPICIEYLNREEDLGIPGLRKAKQDWHPITQLKKGVVEVI